MKRVYVCSMSRSGGTLLYQMIKLVVEMRDIGRGVGFPMHFKPELENYHDFAIFKTERYFDDYAEPVKSGAALAVGTWRDPRDVAASLLRFYCDRERFRNRKANDDREPIQEMEDVEVDADQIWSDVAFPALVDAIDWFSKWEALDPYLSSYEAVHPNHWKTFLQGIGIQMNIDITPKESAWIYSALTPAKNLKRQREMTEWISPSTMLTKAHISENRGRKGTWSEWLNDDQLEQVRDIAGSWMALHGYRWTE